VQPGVGTQGAVARHAARRLFYITPEPWPTFRADIRVLFGKYLPRNGIGTDLVTEQADVGDGGDDERWPAGELIGWKPARNRGAYHLLKLAHSIRALFRVDRRAHLAVQVRDMPVHAALALIAARWKKVPFYFWMSFPLSEAQVLRARARGPAAGLKYWFPLVQGTIGRWLLFGFVLPRADHIFVQSLTMQEDLQRAGIPKQKLTPVPMGVDLECADRERVAAMEDARIMGRNVLVYLGTLDRERQVEKLFQMLALVREREPETVLLLVGDTQDNAHRRWLSERARECGVMENLVWTGWVPVQTAWRYVRAAHVALSPFPRGSLLDSASPTKAVEYLALGVPVVVNDNPDQEMVVRESGAGICVSYDARLFADAVLKLLTDAPLRQDMAGRGRQYVADTRDYGRIGERLAQKYRELLRKEASIR
jgi:glycosyltransferase involved in cell wall biosynthesis